MGKTPQRSRCCPGPMAYMSASTGNELLGSKAFRWQGGSGRARMVWLRKRTIRSAGMPSHP
eukprot:445870-Lingulodinium_polyedra.AAC.1